LDLPKQFGIAFRANRRIVALKIQTLLTLSIREVDPVEILMELLFDFLSTLELHSRLLNVRIARKSFQQNQRLLVGHLFLVFASDRERCSKRV
jgi:hypothetical protein